MKYDIEQIKANDNLIFDLKKDIIFKKVFLDEKNINYLKSLLSLILKTTYNINLKLANIEIPNDRIDKKVSVADLILKDKELEYIIEMNYNYSKSLYYKNIHYLLKEHTKRSHKNNRYGMDNNTILINIDNYDVLKKKELIYKINLKDSKYSNNMYNNIETIHINLEYLKNKYYNNYKLNDLEKLLIVFIEIRKDKILRITNNKYVKEVLEYMDYLKIGDDYITVYNKEEFERTVALEMEENRKKLESDKTKLESDKTKLESDKTKLESDKTKFENEKKSLAKELKRIGIPINKIMKLTKLSMNDIMML